MDTKRVEDSTLVQTEVPYSYHTYWWTFAAALAEETYDGTWVYGTDPLTHDAFTPNDLIQFVIPKTMKFKGTKDNEEFVREIVVTGEIHVLPRAALEWGGSPEILQELRTRYDDNRDGGRRGGSLFYMLRLAAAGKGLNDHLQLNDALLSTAIAELRNCRDEMETVVQMNRNVDEIKMAIQIRAWLVAEGHIQDPDAG